MSVRLIAMDLYRLMKEVRRLEKELADASPESKARTMDALRRAKAEQKRLRDMLEGHKDASRTPPRIFK